MVERRSTSAVIKYQTFNFIGNLRDVIGAGSCKSVSSESGREVADSTGDRAAESYTLFFRYSIPLSRWKSHRDIW